MTSLKDSILLAWYLCFRPKTTWCIVPDQRCAHFCRDCFFTSCVCTIDCFSKGLHISDGTTTLVTRPVPLYGGGCWSLFKVRHTGLPHNREAGGVAKWFIRLVILTYAMPKSVVSDLGTGFCNSVLDGLFAIVGIKYIHTKPYHPQANAQVEGNHPTAKWNITGYIAPNHKDWRNILPFATYPYNTAIHDALDMSPFRGIFTWTNQARTFDSAYFFLLLNCRFHKPYKKHERGSSGTIQKDKQDYLVNYF